MEVEVSSDIETVWFDTAPVASGEKGTVLSSRVPPQPDIISKTTAQNKCLRIHYTPFRFLNGYIIAQKQGFVKRKRHAIGSRAF